MHGWTRTLTATVPLLVLATVARADALTGPLPAPTTLSAGAFRVEWTPAQGGRLAVTRPDAPGRVFWESRAGRTFVEAARGRTTIDGKRGFFSVHERGLAWTASQTIDAIEAVTGGVVVRGRLLPAAGFVHVFTGPPSGAAVRYRLRFDAVAGSPRHLRFDLTLDASPASAGVERVALVGASEPDERFVGFGPVRCRQGANVEEMLRGSGRPMPSWCREHGSDCRPP